MMMKTASEETQAELERRIVAASLSWEPLKANLEGLPTCVPRGHRITFFKYLPNGLLTIARLRFIDEVIVRDCPSCGLDRCDGRRHWVTWPVLKSIFRELYAGNAALVRDQGTVRRTRTAATSRFHPCNLEMPVCHITWVRI